MGKMTPSQAKNAIRRALLGVVDPHPSATQIHQIWAYFGSACAYCGKALVRGERDGHIDHLVSTGSGGSNALGNFVLACSICNGDEKRDEHWDTFLHRKAPAESTYVARKKMIDSWVVSCKSLVLDQSLANTINLEIDEVIAAFEKALHRIRQLKSGA